MTEKQWPRNSRNTGNKMALASLSVGLVVISNNQFIRFNLVFYCFMHEALEFSGQYVIEHINNSFSPH